MNQASVEEIYADSELTDVKSEQIRILFTAIPTSLFTILVCSAVLSIAQWQVIDHETIIGWFILTNLLSLLRLLMYQQFKRKHQGRLVDGAWTQRAILTSLASGATWGAGGFLLFADFSPVHQMFLALVITGICAGAITTLSAVTAATRGFVVLAISPILFRFYTLDHEFSLAMTVMSILFATMILVSAERLFRWGGKYLFRTCLLQFRCLFWQ